MIIKKYTGLSNNNYKYINLSQNVNYLLRNLSLDENCYVIKRVELQDGTFTNTRYDLQCGAEITLSSEGVSTKLLISTNTDYQNINIQKLKRFSCVSCFLESNSLGNDNNSYIVSFYNIVPLDCKITLQAKSRGYNLPLLDTSNEYNIMEQQGFPSLYSISANFKILGGAWSSYFNAGRGYLINSIDGVDKEILANKDQQLSNLTTQGIKISWQKDVDTLNFENNQLDISTNLLEIPYCANFTEQTLKNFNNNTSQGTDRYPLTFIQNYVSDIGTPLFTADVGLKQDGQGSSTQPNIYIYKKSDIIQKENIIKATLISAWQDRYKEPCEIEGTYYNNLTTPLMKVKNTSQYDFYYDTFNVSNINSFCVDLKVTSQEYPFSISFSAPIFTGITFESATQLKVYLRDRECIFNLSSDIKIENKLCRYAVVYGVTFLELYINGKSIQLESQNTLILRDMECNSLGYDVKYSYKRGQGNLIKIKSKTLETNKITFLPTLNATDDYVKLSYNYSTSDKDNNIYGTTATSQGLGILPYKIDTDYEFNQPLRHLIRGHATALFKPTIRQKDGGR